ncbi:prepilin-type N-terminal cleavage/methylation domain-containing protein [Hymenobacter sp. BT186]|uniref:Prepilin-type N-terminal cleavage/methylation domain-containing protein n=1 Tax=Hymenobacter telluris TaxID=2816474 RepID=A0A939F4B2_9BACT|nr:prepilin-type N-terminal cleavage/methylation domain-containing protein [Hymenobacter telluris]MBO0361133.1 prepilin-type N-terminal cleavage/methylation domain-containing protein [Hymenobacter telluris]MBW3377161.1 prepilin-type N-terminal cleavage/methylation domain-containing protein [Hymenobacter norwichensis]
MRLNAFTLLETMMAMALSAVVISAAYLTLQVIQRQQQASLRSLSSVTQVSTLQWVLARDFRQSTHVRLTGQRLLCQQGETVIEYDLLDSCIVRQQHLVQDTFQVRVLDYAGYFKTAPVSNKLGTIDEVVLTVCSRQDTLVLEAAAWYDTQQLLEMGRAQPATL